MNSELYFIGSKVNTDKIYHHGYHRFYSQYIKRDIKKLLEIGIDQGRSLNLWLQYCPNAFIFGLDINSEYSTDRVRVLKGDQSKQEDLEKVIQYTESNIDVILDDGSHIPEHQLFSFNFLFPYLQSGGVYVIEDIETSYWKTNGLYGYLTRYGIKHNTNIINVFQNILHLLNREYLQREEINEICNVIPIDLDVIDSISTITFCQNCIIIKKKEMYEYNYVNRPYRFVNNIQSN